MIRSLRIENFALIEAVTIRFESGFTVITGETGSGKSILLNALNLILGQRADFSVIGNAKDKSVVEAEIDISGFDLKHFFEVNQLDYYDTAIVRREIYQQGRSRAFINDTPVQLNVLKEFSGGLIHIHSQYNTLELKSKDFQLKLLDVLAGTIKERTEYENGFRDLQFMKKELAEKEQLLSESASRSDYEEFQLSELKSLDLENTDYESLLNDLKKFENAEDLLRAFSSLVNLLEAEGGVINQLNQVKVSLEKNIEIDAVLKDLYNRISSVMIELKDIASEAEDQGEAVSIDPGRLAELTARLDTYNKISFKHRTSSQQELMEIMRELSDSSEDLEQLQSDIEKLKSKASEAESELIRLGEDLHEKRNQAIPSIEEKITHSLNDLKLENTTVEFRLKEENHLLRTGKSSLEIYFSPNIGIDPVPIHQAASGGELSRVMLALQSLMSKKIQLQTILFDEIDTGVSGDVASKIGNTLREMGEGMQVIAITHLPQVAAKGIQHLSVTKQVVDGKTRTFVKELTLQERLEETARLMSGDEINEAALANAKALMS